MIVIGIMIVVILLFIANEISNIKINMQIVAHNTAKCVEHLFDIKNKLVDPRSIEEHLISINRRLDNIANEL